MVLKLKGFRNYYENEDGYLMIKIGHRKIYALQLPILPSALIFFNSLCLPPSKEALSQASTIASIIP